MEYQQINTALLSYGMSGEVFHGPLLEAHPAFDIVAVLHRDKAKKPRHAYPTVDDIDLILKNSSVELVVVNTPNQTHFEYAKLALQAGKHVVVEKPFTVNIQEAEELIALAKTTNKILTVFQSRRWDGDFLTVQKILQEKLLGRVVEFEAHYDRYRNYIEGNSWKEMVAPGTGILYNLGSHMIDQALVLFGMPEYVNAKMGAQRPNGKVDDYYDIRMEYNNLNVIVKSSYLVREHGPRYCIHGTEGSFVKYGIDPQEQALKEKENPGGAGWGIELREFWGTLNTTINGLHVEGVVETVAGNYLGFYSNVYEAVRVGKPLAVKPEESKKVIRVIEACIESSKSRKSVKI